MPKQVTDSEKRVKLNCLIAPLTMERIKGQPGSQGEVVDRAMMVLVGAEPGARIDAPFPPTRNPHACILCGATDHERIQFGGQTITACKKVREYFGTDLVGFNLDSFLKSAAEIIDKPRPKKQSKADQVIAARAASDLTAQAVERPDIDYSDVESTPTQHIASLDAVGPSAGSATGKASLEAWRRTRKPLLKPSEQKGKVMPDIDYAENLPIPPMLWYENKDGHRHIPHPDDFSVNPPDGFDYQRSNFPCTLEDSVLRLIRDETGRVTRSEAVMTGHCGWSEHLVLAMANSGKYRLSEAILVVATSCERCMNALAHAYGLDWGYPPDSEDYETCGTRCRICELKDLTDS